MKSNRTILHQKEQGFTLLEVIMAMVILSIGLIPLFAIFGGYMDAMRKMGDENEKSQAREQILAYMDAINPNVQKEGSLDLPNYTFSWIADPIVENLENTEEQRGKGNFLISLYDTKVTASKPQMDPWLEFTIRQIGYSKKPSAGPAANQIDNLLDEDDEDDEKAKPKAPPKRPSIEDFMKKQTK